MSDELTFDNITKAMEKMRSWCNHQELFEEDTMGLPIDHSYIFRCKCGKERLFKPPKEMIDRLKEDSSIIHAEARSGKPTDFFGIKLYTCDPVETKKE